MIPYPPRGTVDGTVLLWKNLREGRAFQEERRETSLREAGGPTEALLRAGRVGLQCWAGSEV